MLACAAGAVAHAASWTQSERNAASSRAHTCLLELSSDVARHDAGDKLGVKIVPATEDPGHILAQRHCPLIRARALESLVHGTTHVAHIVGIRDNKDRRLVWSDEMIEMVLHPAVRRHTTIEPARICEAAWSC